MKIFISGLKHIFILLLLSSLLPACSQTAEEVVGNTDFVHLEKVDNVWWLVDAKGEKFVSTGMNHIQSNIRFADYNKAFWAEKFGENILSNGHFNPKAIPEVKNWMTQVAKDHKDYGFNTIPFHRNMNIPDTYFEDLEIYYLGKIKTGIIHAGRAKFMTKNGKFPDVFSEAFKLHADRVAKDYCTKHKDNKYLLGYSYEDLPAYEYDVYWQQYLRNKKGFEYTPWVADIINVEGITKGKEIWLDILKKQYSGAEEAARNYQLKVSSWDDLATVSEWPEPVDKKKCLKDQEEMSRLILDTWHRINREVILKYDPNHLILGDKIFCHGKGHPDWVFEIVGKYVDVLLIQDYEMLKPSHIEELQRYHKLSGKPVLNGDASYAFTVKEQEASKGLQVESHAAVGEEYSIYLKGIMKLPFMLGWHNCGYLEQWTGGRLDDTGKQQTGLFDPYGNPRTDALDQIKQANINAPKWHENAGTDDIVYSKRKDRWD